MSGGKQTYQKVWTGNLWHSKTKSHPALNAEIMLLGRGNGREKEVRKRKKRGEEMGVSFWKNRDLQKRGASLTIFSKGKEGGGGKRWWEKRKKRTSTQEITALMKEQSGPVVGSAIGKAKKHGSAGIEMNQYRGCARAGKGYGKEFRKISKKKKGEKSGGPFPNERKGDGSYGRAREEQVVT